MILIKQLARLRPCRFGRDDDAVIMLEAILAVPILVVLAAGVLEFGTLLYQREQISGGLRDAVRYMSRCRHSITQCELVARNLAYYGSSSASDQTLRVPGWDASETITFTTTTEPTQDVLSARTTHNMLHSPIFGFLGIGQISVTISYQQRDVEW